MPQPTTMHHNLPTPTTNQNVSTTTQYHPPSAKIYTPTPTTSKNISTTTYHFPKNGPPPCKFDIALTVSFSSKWNIPFRDGDFVWQSFHQFVFQIPNFYYILQYLIFYNKKLYFTSLRLQDLYCLFL